MAGQHNPFESPILIIVHRVIERIDFFPKLVELSEVTAKLGDAHLTAQGVSVEIEMVLEQHGHSRG